MLQVTFTKNMNKWQTMGWIRNWSKYDIQRYEKFHKSDKWQTMGFKQ